MKAATRAKIQSFHCPFCDESKYCPPAIFESHIRLHIEEDPFSCYSCNDACEKVNVVVRQDEMLNIFPQISTEQNITSNHNKRSVMRKSKNNQTVDKTANCEICSKSFGRKEALKVHIRSIHKKERNFNCKLCTKSFFGLYGLEIHLRSHTGERPYKCDTCGKGFSHTSHRSEHMKLHEEVEGHRCAICGKTFKLKTYLVHHQLWHNTEKPFPCTLCGKAFKTLYKMNEHLTRHTKLKPYKCSICHRAFADKYNCNRHMKNIHDKKLKIQAKQNCVPEDRVEDCDNDDSQFSGYLTNLFTESNGEDGL